MAIFISKLNKARKNLITIYKKYIFFTSYIIKVYYFLINTFILNVTQECNCLLLDALIFTLSHQKMGRTNLET